MFPLRPYSIQCPCCVHDAFCNDADFIRAKIKRLEIKGHLSTTPVMLAKWRDLAIAALSALAEKGYGNGKAKDKAKPDGAGEKPADQPATQAAAQ